MISRFHRYCSSIYGRGSPVHLRFSPPIVASFVGRDIWTSYGLGLFVTPSNPTRRFCLFQAHPPICGPLPLSFSQSISPSPFLTIGAYFCERLIFFLLCFFVDLVYIFRFPIIIFVWKLRKCERMCFLEDFQEHNQIP